MKTNIVDIGNSKGILVSQEILQQCHITDKADMSVHKNRIVLAPVKKVRKNWDRAFRKMAERKEDTLLMESVPYNNEDWQW